MSTQELVSCVPKLLVLPSRLTPMFLVQFPVPLGFSLLFMVILDLDLGAPGHWGRASMGMSLWLPLPFVPQTPRVGRNYKNFLSAKFANLHATLMTVCLLRAPYTLGNASLGHWDNPPTAKKFASLPYCGFLRKNKTKFLKRSQNSFSPLNSKMWLLWVPRCVLREMPKTHKLLFLTSSN